MHRIKTSLFLLLTSAILFSCGTVEKRYVLQGTIPEDICSIVETPYSGSTSGKARSEIRELDGELVAKDYGNIKNSIIEDLRDRYKIFINPGNHKIIVSCWRKPLGFAKWFTVEFDAIKGHNYAAKCEFIGDCGMFTCESVWWVEIVDLDTNEAVTKSDEIRTRQY